MVKGRNACHVIESFRAPQPETEIVIPSHWGSAAHLEDQTQNLRLDSPVATLLSQPIDATQRVLRAHPGQHIELSYDIVPQQTEWFHHPQEHVASN